MIRKLALVWLVAITLVGCNNTHQPDMLQPGEAGRLTIYSTTDTEIFRPVITDFNTLYPGIAIEYVELDSAPLNDRVLDEHRINQVRSDIIFSAAMDMQVKLVNDGLAARHISPNAAGLPDWAQWRREAFGLTFEPVVMLYNPRLFGSRPVPQSRAELAKMLAADPQFWQGRIGTYDIAQSSVGYLLATQDARQSSEFGALGKVMGSRAVRTYANTRELIADIEEGRIALGYNVLGSYAKRQIAAGGTLKIVYPQDYTLAIIRTAVIPKRAPNPRSAHAFLEYLLSHRGQNLLVQNSFLSAARDSPSGAYGRIGITGSAVGPLRPIPLGPGLMTYLDRQKKERFIANWQAMTGNGLPVASVNAARSDD
jgi:iron(III) transport system substrate-binding protein